MADIWIREGDSGPELLFTLTDVNDNPIDATGASPPLLFMQRIHGAVLLNGVATTWVDAATGQGSYAWVDALPEGDAGYICYFLLTYLTGEIVSFPNDGELTVSVPAEIGGGS